MTPRYQTADASSPLAEPLAQRLVALGRAARALAAGAVPMFNKGDGPPDLDELWRDFNRKLSGLFGGKGGGNQRPPRDGGGNGGGGGGNNFQPDMKSAGIGVSLIAGIALLVWLGSGIFIVQEGQQAVVSTFGRFANTREAGIQFRWPYPFQAHETVSVTQLQSVDVGRNSVVQATGLRDSSMLTQDENIIDIRFTVQYRRANARAYLFENFRADDAVRQAAETAVREVVGRSNVDAVLYEQRTALSTDLVKSIQAQLNRLNSGILVDNVNVQSVQVPEQVQAAFDDAFKAGADRDRLKNEGQAYAANEIPKAQGTAARLKQEADAHRATVTAQAEGDAQRFRSVLAEYQKAPAVTRDRLYLETMQTVYSNVSKVMVESRSGSNLLYLPLDRLMQQAGIPAPAATSVPPAVPATDPVAGTDPRAREGARSRERESR
jgi:modulator of FtsH protease HflK